MCMQFFMIKNKYVEIIPRGNHNGMNLEGAANRFSVIRASFVQFGIAQHTSKR